MSPNKAKFLGSSVNLPLDLIIRIENEPFKGVMKYNLSVKFCKTIRKHLWWRPILLKSQLYTYNFTKSGPFLDSRYLYKAGSVDAIISWEMLWEIYLLKNRFLKNLQTSLGVIG